MDEFYTVYQAANILKVHPLTIRRYIRDGKLKAHRIEGNIRISTHDLRLFFQNLDLKPSFSSPADSSDLHLFNLEDPIFSLEAKGNSVSEGY